MKELAQDGMTMVVVTHEIGFAAEVADRVIFMDRGKIVADGTPDEVIKNSSIPRVKEFFAKVL
jgi:ABC-type polar amino acid transport system ATPase subunit